MHAQTKLRDYENRLTAVLPKPSVATRWGAPEPSLPSSEVLATPYAAAHKYLARELSRVTSVAELRGTTPSVEKIAEQLLAEQNDPHSNPNLKPGGNTLMQRVASRVATATALRV